MYYLDQDTNTIDKFDLAKFMDFGTDGAFDPINSYMLLNIPKLPPLGYRKVTIEEHRPDLLAHNIYGDTQYWWVILWYNSLTSVNDIKAGMTIKYPALGGLQNLYTNACMLNKVEE